MSNSTFSPSTILQASEINNILQKREKQNGKIEILIGKQNTPVLLDLGEIGHMLVTGWAQSRKVEIIDTIVLSLMLRYTPQEISFVLYDNTADFSMYSGNNPYLLTDVINHEDKVLSALKWTIEEINHRFVKFQKIRVRTISEFNESSAEKLPHIVIILKTLDTLYYAEEITTFIRNIVTRGKNTGIHLILITNNINNQIIPQAIQANIPAKIICKVITRSEARNASVPDAHILADNEFYVIQTGKEPEKLTMFDVAEDVKKIAENLKSAPYKMPTDDPDSLDYVEHTDLDPFFDQAVALVSKFDKASASLLQRRLKLGYARAARLLDELEHKGYIAAAEGSKPREVIKRKAAINTILLVEDDTWIREFYSNILQNSGYSMDVAEDGVKGLDKIKKIKYDLILLGIMMPNMTGIDVLEQLAKEKIPHGKIIMFTNLDTPEIKQQTFRLGASDFWVKAQLTPVMLLEKIKKLTL